MQLNLLLNAISREKPAHFVQMSNPKREIDSTRMLLDSDPVRRTDMLYICDYTFYKKLTPLQRQHGNFLVLGARPEDVECHQEDDMNLILLPKHRMSRASTICCRISSCCKARSVPASSR